MQGRIFTAQPKDRALSEGIEDPTPATIEPLTPEQAAALIDEERVPTLDIPKGHAMHGVFGKMLEDGTPYMSPSQIKKVAYCGFDWAESYIRKAPRKTSIPFEFGKACHKAFQIAANASKEGTLFTPKEAGAIAEKDAFRRFTDPGIVALMRDKSELDPAPMSIKARECMEVAWEWFITEDLEILDTEGIGIQRLTVTHPFTQADVEVAQLGYFDFYARYRKTGETMIGDLKFVKGGPSRDLIKMAEVYGVSKDILNKKEGKDPAKYPPIYGIDRDHFHPLLSYADVKIGLGQRVDKVVAVNVTKAVTPKVFPVPLEVTSKMLAWARSVTRGGMQQVLTQNLPPNPFSASFRCKGCDNRDACPANAEILEGALPAPKPGV